MNIVWMALGIIGMAPMVLRAYSDKIPKHECVPVDSISVVIPTYNEERLLPVALASLNAQRLKVLYPDMVEIIVVDNCSTDRTVDIARQMADRVIISEECGKLPARAIGNDEAKGNIIVSADADAYYPPHWLCMLTRHFADKEVVLADGPFDVGFDRTCSHIVSDFIMPISWFFKPEVIHVHGGGSAFRKSVWVASGGFRNVNQSRHYDMVTEEEKRWPISLLQYGKYVFDIKAKFFVSGRRESRIDEEYEHDRKEKRRFQTI
jgi:hypothetical protein